MCVVSLEQKSEVSKAQEVKRIVILRRQFFLGGFKGRKVEDELKVVVEVVLEVSRVT